MIKKRKSKHRKGKTVKQCPECKIKKSFNEFPKNKNGKNGLFYRCKLCCYKAYKKWILANPERYRELGRNWRIKNRTRHTELTNRWRKENPIRYRELQKRANRQTRSTLNGRLNSRMDSMIYSSLRQNKAGRKWKFLVGYTLESLKKHLESLFSAGMTWNAFMQGKIHIDHVVPKSRFHYEKPEDPEFKVCWGLNNLQPLWAKDNISKHAKTMEEWKGEDKKIKNAIKLTPIKKG